MRATFRNSVGLTMGRGIMPPTSIESPTCDDKLRSQLYLTETPSWRGLKHGDNSISSDSLSSEGRYGPTGDLKGYGHKHSNRPACVEAKAIGISG